MSKPDIIVDKVKWDGTKVRLEDLLDTEAIAQVKKIKALTAAHARFINDCDIWSAADNCTTHLGAKWFLSPAAAWLVAAVSSRMHCEDFAAYMKTVVKPLGLKAPPFEAILAALQPKPAAVAPKKPAAKAAAKKPAVKAPAKAATGKKGRK